MRTWIISVVAVSLIVGLCLAVAIFGFNESVWSLGQALVGHPGASSVDVEAARVKAALLSNDSWQWATVSPQSRSELERGAGPHVSAVQWAQGAITPAANNPDNALVWADVKTGDTGIMVGFFLTRGALTGWRADGYELSP